MTRAYGRAARGERVNQSVPRNHGTGVSVIGSLGLRGVLAPLSMEGAVDTLVFDSYVSRMLLSQASAAPVNSIRSAPE